MVGEPVTRAAIATEGANTTDRLRDILWMVRSIDALTLAGQRHELPKIAGLLEDELIFRRAPRSAARLETMESLLSALRVEAGRLLPDARRFAAQAEILIGTATRSL